MISVDIDQLCHLMNGFLWPFFRILGLVGVAPILGESSIPVRLRVGLAAVCTLVAAPMVGPMPDVPTASFAGLLIACQQVLIGIALGLTMRIVFAAVLMAGEFVGLQLGQIGRASCRGRVCKYV